MAKISLFPKLLFMFINLNLFFLIESDKIKEDPTLKALSCIKIINKNFKIEDPKSPNDFQLILTCYSMISYEQSSKVLESGPEALTNEEVMNLSDIYLLKNIPDNEVKKNTADLEAAIKTLQLKDEIFSEKDKDKDKAKENKEENTDNSNNDNVQNEQNKDGNDKNDDIYNDISGDGDGDGDNYNFGDGSDLEYNDPYDDNMEFNDPYNDNMEYNDMYDGYDGMYDGNYDDSMYDGDGDYYNYNNEHKRKYVYDPEFEKKKKIIVIILVSIFGVLTVYFLFVVINDQKSKRD